MMIWFLLLFALQVGAPQCQPAATPTERPSLVVQAVDPMWLPIPNAQITVQARDGKQPAQSIAADENGYARFQLLRETEYSISAGLAGYQSKRMKHILIKNLGSGPFSTAYVQLQLKYRPIVN